MTDVSHSLLMLVLTSEVALLTAAALVLVGLHARRWWYARRTERLLARGRALVTAVADGQTVPDADTAWLASLSARVQTKLCVTFARSLDGAGRRRLHAARLLSLIGGGSTAVPRLLKDRHPEVRAQAAEWAGQHPDPAVIEDLLELLSDPWGLCRFSAQDSLERLGRAVEGPLVDHLAGKRATEAALQVAAGIPGPRLRTPALALVCDPRDGMRAQAATVLAAIGDGADVPVLASLLDDPVPGVRAAATQGLGRLGHWPASPKVSLLLRDQAWVVRREAALALRAMGAPGTLLLRRALTSDDRFAADMAKQVLGLPGTAE